jgi:pyruvate,water dikinase
MKKFILDDWGKIWGNEVYLVGNKAARLAHLFRSQVAVPEAFVLTTEAFSYFLKKNSFHYIYETMDQSLSRDEIALLAADLREKILRTKFPRQLERLVTGELTARNHLWFSVRSSATVEDSLAASFAGLFETDLNLRSQDILSGIKKCWASAFSARVVIYCHKKKIPLNQIKMAVIIQKMINGQKGGTLITQNLRLGQSRQSVIESVRGASDEVTSGLKHPERLVVDRKTLTILKRKTSLWESGVLKDEEARQLLQVGLLAEKQFCLPQEIEWVMDENKIYILQSRPLVA